MLKIQEIEINKEYAGIRKFRVHCDGPARDTLGLFDELSGVDDFPKLPDKPHPAFGIVRAIRVQPEQQPGFFTVTVEYDPPRPIPVCAGML